MGHQSRVTWRGLGAGAMRLLAAASIVTVAAWPAAAEERMTRTKCQQAFQRLANMVDSSDPNIPLQTQFVRVTDDAWCQFRTSDPGFEDVPFEEIDWRLEDSARWIDQGIPPLAVQVRIRGIDPQELQEGGPVGRPKLDLEATLRQEPDAGLVIVERIDISNAEGDRIALSGVFERVFLSSPSMMQVSLGSATFKAGLATMTLVGTYENPFGLNASVQVTGSDEAQSEAIFKGLTAMPEGVIDSSSRAELMAYAADLPRPIGTLEVQMASERGLGMMQIGAAMYSTFVSIMEDDDDASARIAREMEIMFDGMRITADWTPADKSVAD